MCHNAIILRMGLIPFEVKLAALISLNATLLVVKPVYCRYSPRNSSFWEYFTFRLHNISDQRQRQRESMNDPANTVCLIRGTFEVSLQQGHSVDFE